MTRRSFVRMGGLALPASVFIVIANSPTVFAAPKSCSCEHIRSLQQELANLDYQARFFESLSQRLKRREEEQIEINRNPEHPDSNRSVLAISARARDDIIAQEFKLPFSRVEGYTGPNTIDLPFGQCEQRKEDIDALVAGSPCQESASASLEHEREHQEKCRESGADDYWGRLPSAIATEEQGRYENQEQKLRAVLDGILRKPQCSKSWLASSNIVAPESSRNYARLCAPTPAGRWTLVQTGAGGVGQGSIEIPGEARFTAQTEKMQLSGTFEASLPATNANRWTGDAIITQMWDHKANAPGVMELHQRYLHKCKCTLAGCKPCEYQPHEKVVRWQLTVLPETCDPASLTPGPQ